MIDDESQPGSWRAALDQAATCAVCRQHVCGHSDMEYQGLVPTAGPVEMLPQGDASGVIDFSNSVLGAIASSLGISYDRLSDDFGKANYSSECTYFHGTRKLL